VEQSKLPQRNESFLLFEALVLSLHELETLKSPTNSASHTSWSLMEACSYLIVCKACRRGALQLTDSNVVLNEQLYLSPYSPFGVGIATTIVSSSLVSTI